MRQTEEQRSRLASLTEAAQVVSERHFPVSLGPCHYCDWPVTKCFCSVWGLDGDKELVPTCELCFMRVECANVLPLIWRIWEHEEPACAI